MLIRFLALRQRFLVLVMVTVAFGLVGTAGASASSGVLTISGSMEGNLQINPGDTLRAGFDITMPGSHPAATVVEFGGSVTIHAICANGTTDDLVISLPPQSFSISANNSDWFPSGDQSSPSVYQGSITAPDACGAGQSYHAPKGATFTANFSSTDNVHAVHVRFHYSDNKLGSSWSGTASIIPPPPTARSLYFGYADTYDSRGTGVPSVWQNSPAPGFSAVIFEGCGLDPTSTSCVPSGGQYDSAAIRIDNPAGNPDMTVTNPMVAVGPTGGAPACSYNPWGPGFTVTVPGGQELVLTQTGGPDPCHNNLTGNYNFDVSESWQRSPVYPSCTSDEWTPMLTITIDGVTRTVVDSGEVLNTGGFDVGGPECGGSNEFQDWVAQPWPF